MALLRCAIAAQGADGAGRCGTSWYPGYGPGRTALALSCARSPRGDNSGLAQTSVIGLFRNALRMAQEGRKPASLAIRPLLSPGTAPSFRQISAHISRAENR